MKWSFRLATIAGTEVRIHVTFLLLLLFVAGQASSAGEGSAGALSAVLLVCSMFLCVLLHEFGHVLAARRYGINTPDITLLPIGGVARLERMPRKPSEELVVAVCGPLVNVAIAALLALVRAAPVEFATEVDLSRPAEFFHTLMWWNVLMVFFNMIPAFPMDGGRVLRALLTMMMGNYARATRLAASIGQGIAVFAVMYMLVTQHLNPTTLLIAFFVFFAAGQEAAMVQEQEETHQLSVRDAMMTEFHTLPPQASLREAVDMLLAGSQHDFPVLDGGGGLRGMLLRQRLIGALADHGPGHRIEEIIEPCETFVEPQVPLDMAMEHLRLSRSPALPVMDPVSGRLVGLLTAENVGEALLVHAAIRRRLDQMA